MRTTSELRTAARMALQGNWGKAVLVGLVASLLGGTGSSGPEINFEYNDNGANVNLEFAGQTIYSTSESLNPQLVAFLTGAATFIIIAAIVFAVIMILIGSIVEIGYAKVNLNLMQHEEPSFDTLFAYLPYWKTAVISSLLRSLYVLLWSLLFIIPGIVASYSYRMTSYILAENPDLTASEAIDMSKQMMEGKRMDLFILELTFLGWDILCMLTLGIGYLWLGPYKQATFAAFYKDLRYGAPGVI